MPTLRLISTHRLDPEKGWDLILSWLKEILKNKNIWKLHYDIYGDGSLRSEIEELARSYPDQIMYHGYVPLQVIFDRGVDYDFVIMPSHFIETFGLSALDFAQFGVPTVGFAKGGLRQFIPENLDIYNAPGESLQEKFTALMSKIIGVLLTDGRDELQKNYSIDKNTIITKYGFLGWVKNFSNIIK